ncbi:hypothetical protein [Nonomuraea sp. NPDC005650]|uniref:hypothetical protein n=1 Tax=Nonomuraea sp. NPDC005650 TaxID=3157045 RepID=UPI0033A04B28
MSAMPGNAPGGQAVARPGHVQAGGARIYYEVRGAGPALVFVPGGGVDATHFAAFAPLLADHHTTVTYGRRRYFRGGGHGPSTIPRQADDLAASGVAAGAYGGAVLAPVDERDVAAVAAHLLTHGLTGCTFEVTGPQALTQIERVGIIGEVTGRPARFHETPASQAAGELRRWVPEPAVEQLLDILRSAQERPHRVLDTVQTLTGERPHTYAQWVEHHRAHFLAPA